MLHKLEIIILNLLNIAHNSQGKTVIPIRSEGSLK